MALGPGHVGWFPGMQDPTGETVWAATAVLAAHIRGSAAEQLAGRTVLELGAGTGALASVAVGLRPGPRVLVATDLPHRVDSIRRTIKHAREASAAPLCWGDLEAVSALCRKYFRSDGVEVVLCSDCLYTNWSDNLGGALAETIAAAMSSERESVAIIAYMPRCAQHEKRFFDRARELGLTEEVLPQPEGLVSAPEAAGFTPEELSRVRLLEVRSCQPKARRYPPMRKTPTRLPEPQAQQQR
mmetsp:Transcript_93991/g.275106  ORF Transcript_93991/g.275106 Transcript_93991/m.275106 type:complete len:242 (+) Transcript_93991:104-829(+)